LAMRALLATREFDPPPMAPPNSPKVTSPTYIVRMVGTPPPIEKVLTFLARMNSRTRLMSGVTP